MSNALMAVSGAATDATKRKASIIGLEPKIALKRVSNQTGIQSRAAISRIRTKLWRDGSEALRNVSICRLVLNNRVVKACRDLPDTIDLAVSFDADIAVV